MRAKGIRGKADLMPKVETFELMIALLMGKRLR